MVLLAPLLIDKVESKLSVDFSLFFAVRAHSSEFPVQIDGAKIQKPSSYWSLVTQVNLTCIQSRVESVIHTHSSRTEGVECYICPINVIGEPFAYAFRLSFHVDIGLWDLDRGRNLF